MITSQIHTRLGTAGRMAAVVVVSALAATLAGPTPAAAKVRGKVVRYSGGGANLVGYIAYDDARKGRRPGVLVVHEWWGHNDYVRRRARMLAKLGYVALALDMYGGGQTTSHPKQAKAFTQKAMADFSKARARFEAALALLRKHPRVSGKRVAAIGYCFGGGVVLQMARLGLDLRAVASFHGSLATKIAVKRGAIKARLLVLHGAADPMVPAAQVAAFREEMKQAGAKVRFIAYPGARHAFSNPGADAIAAKFKLAAIRYDKKADRASWAAMKRFFAKVL